MQKPQITAYLKTYCGWSAGVRAVLSKYNLPYTEKDIIANPAFRWEMETKSGQSLSPCVEINDKMLSDATYQDWWQALGSSTDILRGGGASGPSPQTI